jgi:acyl carrier protein
MADRIRLAYRLLEIDFSEDERWRLHSMQVRDKEILEQVCQILAEKAALDPQTIHPESNLAEDLNIDSLDAVEMMFELEERYGIRIPDEKIADFLTVSDVVTYLSERLSQSEGTT